MIAAILAGVATLLVLSYLRSVSQALDRIQFGLVAMALLADIAGLLDLGYPTGFLMLVAVGSLSWILARNGKPDVDRAHA